MKYPECTRMTVQESGAEREYRIYRDHGYIWCINRTGERTQVMRPSEQPGVVTAVTATSKTLAERVLERCSEDATIVSHS